MKKATLGNVQAGSGPTKAYVKSSAKQPVLITDEGEPVAVLVGLKAQDCPSFPAKARDQH